MSELDKNQDGFTVVELIVTLVVAAILIFAVNAIFTTQVYISQRARDLALANAYAEGKIESLRSAGFLGLTNGTSNITSELPAELSNPRNGTLVVSDYNAAVKRAVLTITYNEQGLTRTYTYTTFVGELGVGQY